MVAKPRQVLSARIPTLPTPHPVALRCYPVGRRKEAGFLAQGLSVSRG